MRPSRLLFLLLLLPGLAFGPGWSLRICAHRLLGAESCCDVEPSCCSDEGASVPSVVEAETPDPCAACCIDIETSVEASVRSPEPPGKDLKRAQVVTLDFALPVSAPGALAPAARLSGHGPPRPPGSRIPLPLRI